MRADTALGVLLAAPAPSAIDATVKAPYTSAAIYFPYSDLIVADRYKDIMSADAFCRPA